MQASENINNDINNSANCEPCARKILEFISNIKHDDEAHICFDSKKINMETKRVELTTVPFIYSAAQFGTNLMLCNYDTYIKRLVDLPECVNVNVNNLHKRLSESILGIGSYTPSKDTVHYSSNMFAPNTTVTFDKTYYIHHTFFSKYTSRSYRRKELAFCNMWEMITEPFTNRPTFDK
jgi:hypothetical protein